jgi:hypothetical protein
MMQLPNSNLWETLQDIANNVEIQTNFSIYHPDYKPLELSTEAINHFQSLPVSLQLKYLNLQLNNFLYGIYYNGSLKAILAPESESKSKGTVLPNIENNTLLGVDREFYDRLHQSNCSQGYFDPGWQVKRQESDGSLAVTRGELTLHIDRNRHLAEKEQTAVEGNLVAIRMPKNLVQNGFYMAVGNAGHDSRSQLKGDSVLVRVYFHLTPEGAVAVMADLTQQLNKIEIPFSFKVLYNPTDYQRYDSGVLYFDCDYYPLVRQVLQKVYFNNQQYFQPQVPLFTKQIAPGLAVAEEPKYKFTAQESFGTNRCQIITNGLLESWEYRETAADFRLGLIVQNFSLLGIDLKRPFLNAGSEDIYDFVSG